MAQLNFKAEINEKEIRDQIDSALTKETRASIQHFIQANFGRKEIYPYNEGPMTLMIRETIDKKFLSENFQQRIEQYIDENFERVFNEAMEKALEHKARAIAFNHPKMQHLAREKE